MKARGERMEEIVVVENPQIDDRKFCYLVCSIKESNNVATQTIDELQSSLLVHEQRMNGQKKEKPALKVTSAGRTGSRSRERNNSRGGSW